MTTNDPAPHLRAVRLAPDEILVIETDDEDPDNLARIRDELVNVLGPNRCLILGPGLRVGATVPRPAVGDAQNPAASPPEAPPPARGHGHTNAP